MARRPDPAAARAAVGRLARSPEYRRLALVVVVAAAVRIAWAVYAARPPQGGDPASYVYYAKEIARGRGYVSVVTHEPTAFYPPGYPAALAAVFFLLFHSPLPDDLPMAAAIFNVVLGVATVVLTYEVARRLVGSTVALVAAAIQAVFPSLVFHTAVAYTETLFNFMVMASLLVILARPWPEGRVSRGRLLVFGAVLGASALVRPFCLLFLAPLVLAWWLSGAGWRRALTQLAWCLLAIAVVLTPWTIRNIVRMDSPITISTNLGDTICISRSLHSKGNFEFCQLDRENAFADVPADELEVTEARENGRQALRFIREHPGLELQRMFWRAYYTFENDREPLEAVESGGNDRFMPRRLRQVLMTVSDAYFFAMVAFGVLGAIPFLGRRSPPRLFFFLSMGALAAVPLGLYGLTRFHIPVLPLLCVVAAVPVAATLRYGRALLAPHEDEPDVRRPGVNGRRGSSADRPVPAVPVS